MALFEPKGFRAMTILTHFKYIISIEQCWGSDILVPLTNDPDPAPDPDPTLDPTPFFIDFKDANKNIFSYFFLKTCPHLQSKKVTFC
jgi:hypothetical protein